MKAKKITFIILAVFTVLLILYLIFFEFLYEYDLAISAIDPDDNAFWYIVPLLTGLAAAWFYIQYKSDVEEYTCPKCGHPGALKKVASSLVNTERIVETRDMYHGKSVAPYTCYGTRSYYDVTYGCPHCGYQTVVREYSDSWDV